MLKVCITESGFDTQMAFKVPVGDLFRTAGYEGEDWFMRVHPATHTTLEAPSYYILAVSMKKGIISLVKRDMPCILATKLEYTVECLPISEQ